MLKEKYYFYYNMTKKINCFSGRQQDNLHLQIQLQYVVQINMHLFIIFSSLYNKRF